MVESLQHFYKLRLVDSDEDDGDYTKQLDCWELIDPTKATSWTTLWSPHTTNLAFATSFVGGIKDPQCIDFDTKITEFDLETADVLKIICSSTKEKPYCFTIAIDTIRIPYSVVDLLESLESSNFDEINSTIYSEILGKKWRTKQDGPLKAKPLAFKLRNVVNSMEWAAILVKGKTTTGRGALDVSGVTQTRSQVQSQASGRGRAMSATARASSTPRNSYGSLSHRRLPRRDPDRRNPPKE